MFEGVTSISILSSEIPESLNLIIFVLRCGHSFDADERKMLKTLMSEWKISRISALALTHCERLSEDDREMVIKQFKQDHLSIAELFGKGIVTVGFPDSSCIRPGSALNQSVEDDIKKLRWFK